MDTYHGLKVEIEESIACITIDRPAQANAIDKPTHVALEKIWPDLAARRDVRAIILTGAGRTFSTGGDIEAMAARAGTEEGWHHALGLAASARRLLVAILDTPQPIIAAVNGHATGLGATLALAADICVIAEEAKFGDTHVNVGLVAGDGGAVLWPMLIGPNRAKELLMQARLLRGSEVYALGLASQLAPAADVLERARSIAADLAAKPPLAVQWTKLTVNQGIKAQLETVLDYGLAYEALSMASSDHGEAAKAIIAKRAPRFRGQ